MINVRAQAYRIIAGTYNQATIVSIYAAQMSIDFSICAEINDANLRT